jgi:hypothetical protein
VVIVNPLMGQCPEYDLQAPRLADVELHIFVEKDNITGIFNYVYSLKNGVANIGCIRRLEIDLTYPPNSIELSKDGLIDYPRYIDRVKKEGIIPVGIPKLPGFKGFKIAWFAGFGVSKRVDWASADIKFDLERGTQLDSIIMTSHGLPGLRAFIVSPKYNPMPPVIVTPENEDSVRANVPWSYEEEMQFQYLLDSIKYRGITIGPTSPPHPFIPLNFLDTLASYTTQSRSLGWIKDQATANKYLNYFATAKDSLQHNKVDTARGFLRQVLKEVDIDSTNNLTSEAYALIRYNTEYLLEHILDQNVTLTLGAGWSMVSVPLLQSNYDADAVFPGKLGAMFGCNMIIQDYEEAENLECGLGYWVFYRNPATINISGPIPETVSATATQVGWVMLGSRHRLVQVSSLVLSNGAEVLGSAFRYSDKRGDYEETMVINPGEAVWIYVTKACTITIP